MVQPYFDPIDICCCPSLVLHYQNFAVPEHFEKESTVELLSSVLPIKDLLCRAVCVYKAKTEL